MTSYNPNGCSPPLDVIEELEDESISDGEEGDYSDRSLDPIPETQEWVHCDNPGTAPGEDADAIWRGVRSTGASAPPPTPATDGDGLQRTDPQPPQDPSTSLRTPPPQTEDAQTLPPDQPQLQMDVDDDSPYDPQPLAMMQQMRHWLLLMERQFGDTTPAGVPEPPADGTAGGGAALTAANLQGVQAMMGAPAPSVPPGFGGPSAGQPTRDPRIPRGRGTARHAARGGAGGPGRA